MDKRIVYIPLDERPCNYEFAKRIADSAKGIEIVRPELSVLGNKKTPADHDGIERFLLSAVDGADACVLSLDMLLYGGIVPSRLHGLTGDEIMRRLSVVARIKAKAPQVKIYAFALIMRCPSYSSADEEPDYYEHCGREIFLSGQAKHKRELGLITETEAQALLAEYGKKTRGADRDFLCDYEARRSVNLSALVEIVKMTGKDIDFLVIPQDDSAPYGYTTRDREELKKIIEANGYANVSTYPGADEVGMTLLSRAVTEFAGVKPKIECVFATDKAKSMIPLYEDRELQKTLVCQIEAAGCEPVERGGDIKLFLNYPAHSHREENDEANDGYAERDMRAFVASIKAEIGRGGIVAIADGAYCNGGDKEFVKALSQNISLFDLAAYAGWNTSSNTLGTAICQAVFALLFGKNYYSDKFLAERFYEDIGYCAHTRRYMCEKVLPKMGYGYFDAGERRGAAAQAVKSELDGYIAELLPEVAARFSVGDCYLPWARMFEAGITASPKAQKPKTLGVWHRPNDTGEETDIDGVKAVLGKFKRAGITVVFLESFYHGYAAYGSGAAEYNPKLARYKYGKHPDYLSAFVAEAQKLGIDVHAWVEDFYVGVEESPLTKAHPDWLMKTKDGRTKQSEGGGYYFLDPANAEACEYLVSVYLELLEKHPQIKGLNLDYIRYPLTARDDDSGYTPSALRGFAEAYSGRPDDMYDLWVEYRAELVTRFVRGVRTAVKQKLGDVLISTAVFPERQLSYETKKQDFARWIEEGYLDFVTPMAYYDDTSKLGAALAETMTFTRGTPCYAGLSCTYHGLDINEVSYQITVSMAKGCDGAVFFGSKSILENADYIEGLAQIRRA